METITKWFSTHECEIVLKTALAIVIPVLIWVFIQAKKEWTRLVNTLDFYERLQECLKRPRGEY